MKWLCLHCFRPQTYVQFVFRKINFNCLRPRLCRLLKSFSIVLDHVYLFPLFLVKLTQTHQIPYFFGQPNEMGIVRKLCSTWNNLKVFRLGNRNSYSYNNFSSFNISIDPLNPSSSNSFLTHGIHVFQCPVSHILPMFLIFLPSVLYYCPMQCILRVSFYNFFLMLLFSDRIRLELQPRYLIALPLGVATFSLLMFLYLKINKSSTLESTLSIIFYICMQCFAHTNKFIYSVQPLQCFCF